MERCKRARWMALPAVIAVLAGLTPARADDAGGPRSANVMASPSGDPIVRMPRLRYQPGDMAPSGYHFESTPRKGLIVAGALTFGVPYVISVMIAGVSHSQADRWLFVPVTGPIGTLVSRDYSCNTDCAGDVLAVTGLAFDLGAQTAGVLLFTMAYVFPKKEWVSDYEVGGGEPPALSWSVLPRVDGDGRVGLTVAGTFF